MGIGHHMVKASIVIPAYNEEKLIERCLKSLVNQTLPRKDYEIIVVDNGSTDKTIEIAKKYADVVISEKKKGVLYARQAGMKKAKSDIILRTDADGYVPKNWVKKGITIMENNPFYVAFSGFYIPDNDKVILKSISKFIINFRKTLYSMGGKTEWLTGSCSAIRKSAFEKIGGYNFKGDPVIEDQQGIGHRLSKIGKIGFDEKWWAFYSPRRFNNAMNNGTDIFNDYFMYQMLNNLYYYVFKKHPKKVLGKWKDIRD